MAKTTADDAARLAELDAAVAKLSRQAEALRKLQRARDELATQQEIARETIRRFKRNLEKAEAEARESGALALIELPKDAPNE